MPNEVFTCSQCGDSFSTAEELAEHRHAMPLAWERGSSPFACDVCGVAFDEADELVTHRGEAHPSA